MVETKDVAQAAQELTKALPSVGDTPDVSWRRLKLQQSDFNWRTKPGRERIEKKTWWWCGTVQVAVREKEKMYE